MRSCAAPRASIRTRSSPTCPWARRAISPVYLPCISRVSPVYLPTRSSPTYPWARRASPNPDPDPDPYPDPSPNPNPDPNPDPSPSPSPNPNAKPTSRWARSAPRVSRSRAAWRASAGATAPSARGGSRPRCREM